MMDPDMPHGLSDPHVSVGRVLQERYYHCTPPSCSMRALNWVPETIPPHV